MCPFNFPGKMAAIYETCISVFGSYLPMFIISLSNIGIVLILKVSERRRREMKADTNSAANKHIFRMLSVISVAYLVFAMPARVRAMIWAFYTGPVTATTNAVQRLSVAITEFCLSCNYACNTYLYILPVKKFREDAKTACFCGLHHKSLGST